jgi:hypothetical protein
MSLQTIEIEAFSGPTSVLIGGGNQPTIVYINQGPAGAAGGTWGSITGTLSSQTDLQTALNLKAPLASPTFTGTVTAPRIDGKCAGLELFCKAGQAIDAGQVVYVTGSSGTNVIIGLAQADTELTSSKTIGICESTLAHNATGYVITEGLMTVSISAPTAAVGDPIWLSGTTAGGMLFGAANKPAYPYHTVYLGVVTRKTGNTIVEMYVKVQNGFELYELSDVLITTPLENQALVRNSDKWINRYLLSSDISDLAASLALKAPLDSPTFTGPVIFGSTTRPTSAGTGTPNATDLITRGDGDARFGAIALTSSLASDGPSVNSTNTSTTLVDSGITLTLPAGTYELSGLLYVTGQARASLILDSSTGVSCALVSHMGSTSGGSTLTYMAQGAIPSFALGNSTSSALSFRLFGRIVLTETRTLKIQYAQNTGNISPTVGKKESFLTATPR